MITTYDDLDKLSKEDYDAIFDLTPEEVANLSKNFPTARYADIRNVMSDYFGIQGMSDEICAKLVADPVIGFDVWCGAARDTATRDLIADTLMKIIGMKHWPMYGSSAEYREAFRKNLPVRLAEFGMYQETFDGE